MVAKKPVAKKETDKDKIAALKKEVNRLGVIVHEKCSAIDKLKTEIVTRPRLDELEKSLEGRNVVIKCVNDENKTLKERIECLLSCQNTLEKELGLRDKKIEDLLAIGLAAAEKMQKLDDLLHIEQEENNANIDALAKKQEECEGLFRVNQQLRIINGSLAEENTSLEQAISALRHEIEAEKEDRSRAECELLRQVYSLEGNVVDSALSNEKTLNDLAVVAESLRRTKEKLDDYVYPCQSIERMLDERVKDWRTLFSSESPMLSASLVISEIFDQAGKAEVLEERIADQAKVIRERDAEVVLLSRPWWKKIFWLI